MDQFKFLMGIRGGGEAEFHFIVITRQAGGRKEGVTTRPVLLLLFWALAAAD